MIRFEKGYLDFFDGKVSAHGYLFGHEEVDEGTYCDLSHIQEIMVKDDNFLIRAISGNIYQLEFKEINESMLDCTEEALNQLGVAVDMERIKTIVQQNGQKRAEWLAGVLNPCELYIRLLTDVSVTHAYYMEESGKIVKANVRYHTGTFQDSILIRDYSKFDFRFFPQGISITPYHWSDGLRAVKIHSICGNLRFRGSFREILCKAGEVTTIESKEYKEGVVCSPDTSGWSFQMDDSWEKLLGG